MSPNVVELQTSAAAPRPSGTVTGTSLITPPQRVTDRLAHFPEEVYDLSAESHLSRLMKVLLGDAGAGQLRKRYLINRLQQSLTGSHFFDLDHFYGALFGVQRKVSELLPNNPYNDTAVSDEWDDIHGRDASYRSRIEQFARAISWGPTPTGMELVAEAILSVDCDIYESFIQADSFYRTYAELEALYAGDGSYADMEGITYSVLEGEGLQRLSGEERRLFIIRPKTEVTLEDAYHLSRVLDRLRPADARFTVEWQGMPFHVPVAVRGLVSDSTYWEIVSKVSSLPLTPEDPYQIPAPTPTEQPRPPFSAYQGEAWSYGGDIAATVSLCRPSPEAGVFALPTERVKLKGGASADFPAAGGLLPRSYVLAGRGVSDAVLIAHPYGGSRSASEVSSPDLPLKSGLRTAKLYTDCIPLANLTPHLLTVKTRQLPYQAVAGKRLWATPERAQEDPAEEILEIRLSGSRLVNYLTYELAHYPHTASAQVYNPSSGVWGEVWSTTIADSVPRVLTDQKTDTHPQHATAGHFIKISARIPPTSIEQFRLVLTRGSGTPPYQRSGRSHPRQVTEPAAVPYSLAVRNLDLGYRIYSREDVPPEAEVVGTAKDLLGSLVQFTLRERPASGFLESPSVPWRCEPQPVNYSVVSLYIDVRDDVGEPQVIDRLYLDPTHPGPHITVYHSSDEGGFESPESFFWTPIPRDYTCQKGYLHLPPTRARYLKLEFTNLVAEPCEAMVPITRKIKLFPPGVVEASMSGRGIGEEALPDGVKAALEVNRVSRYRSAVLSLEDIAKRSRYTPTETLFAEDPLGTERLRDRSWVFGFTPWQPGADAPRFRTVVRHQYDEVEVRHTTKIAFFVGLKALEVYRVDFEVDDDSEVYRYLFHDDRNLEIDYTLTFDDNQLVSTAAEQEAVSRVAQSRNLVRAIQFATQQSQPVQIVPDDDFRSIALGASTFDDPDAWHKVGDAQVIASPADDSLVVVRHVEAPERALGASPGPVRGLVQPVFGFRSLTIEDEEAAGKTWGGVESPYLPVSSAGRIWAAARAIAQTDLTSPLILQIVSATNDIVLAEKEIAAHQGDLLEWYEGYDIGSHYIPAPPVQAYEYRSGIVDRIVQLVSTDPPPTKIPPPPAPPPVIDTVVKIQVIQRGKSDDTWKLDTLSLFDEAMTWEFSVNGGADWYRATGIRNNLNGVLTFPTPGNQLQWRVRMYRPGLNVTAIQIRPWYAGRRNARLEYGPQRGPNVSTYDQVQPISEDPEFTSWTKPIPRSWFAAYKRSSVPGVVEHEISRHVIRLTRDQITVLDGVSVLIIRPGYGSGAYGSGPYGAAVGYGYGAYGEGVYGIAIGYGYGAYGSGPYGS